ncbi:Rieske domain-containing protein, partial [Metarhizium brunneum ARSEF 3297]
MEGRAAQRSGVPQCRRRREHHQVDAASSNTLPAQGSARPKPSEMNWLRSRPDTSWISAGPASSFPNLGEDAGSLIRSRLCDAQLTPGCKIFHVPKDQPSQASEMHISPESLESPVVGDELKDQVLVFQYRGNFHAVDHRCPHQSYPLSNGIPFDIEDFGVVLSAGLSCPKHGWSFDLFTGTADRAAYKLAVWEVQLREKDGVTVVDRRGGDDVGAQDRTVWVRRKPRMG